MGLTAGNLGGSATVSKTDLITVTAAHTVTVTATATPSTFLSGGTTQLLATAVDSSGHGGLAYAWSDNGAGGSFSPSATVRNPVYTAAVNSTGSAKTITFSVTVTCKWYYPWVSGSTQVTATESATGHTLAVTGSATPATVASGGTTQLAATVVDSLGHTGIAWAWSDNGAGGSFSPSAAAPATSRRSTRPRWRRPSPLP